MKAGVLYRSLNALLSLTPLTRRRTEGTRMRLSPRVSAAMAASFGVCGLSTSGRTRLSVCFRTVHSRFKGSFGTKAAAAQEEAPSKKNETRKTPTKKDETESKSFHAVQMERLEQAGRSVLISCPPKTSEKKFLKYLSRHGNINTCFFYESYGMYAVVEFASQDSVASLHKGTSIPRLHHESTVPFKSRLLSLKTSGPADLMEGPSPPCQPQTPVHITELTQRLAKEESIDQQVLSLTEALQLSEENVRLRFLVCSLLRDVAAAYFPECSVFPFGSSVNGFGKLGCDLDMFLDLDSISGRSLNKPKAGPSLEYQMKRASSERSLTQSVLSVIGECVEQFGPGCSGVQKILQARCPLLRFSHQPSGFQCDLTANNRVAMKSSELLFLYGRLDGRVRPLVFAVRCWARAHAVTSPIPGAWLSNFSLTVMVLFFLQRRSPPILPPLDLLRELAGPADRCVVDGNDCTFTSELSQVPLQSNTQSLELLLQEFFEFYGTFAFKTRSINIRKGSEQSKPEVSPLHIQNPFESLNVSKNVNVTQLERFTALCQESAWMLQHREFRAPANQDAGTAGGHAPWGLAALLLPQLSQVAGVKGRRKRKTEPASQRIRSLLEGLKREQV